MLQLSLEHDKKMQEISNKLMWRMIQKAQENGYKGTMLPKVLDVGDESAKQRITKYIENSGASMVVVASRGAGALGRAFVGSFSDYLVHQVDVPVLVAKTNGLKLKASKGTNEKMA